MISTEFEERLREEMRHATTGVSAPAGLVCRARRDRRRRIVFRASTASAAAAVAVAGAVIMSNGTTVASRDSGTYTTAYVVKHVESALDAVNEIAYMHYTSHVVAPMDVWVYDGPQGRAYRAEYFDPRDCQLLQEVGMTATPTNYATYIDVYFFNKTWSKQSYQGPKPSETSCGFSLPTSWATYPEIAAGLRENLACGALSFKGMQQVDGVNALKLVSVQRSPLGPKTLGAVTTIIWGGSRYLPSGPLDHPMDPSHGFRADAPRLPVAPAHQCQPGPAHGADPARVHPGPVMKHLIEAVRPGGLCETLIISSPSSLVRNVSDKATRRIK